MLIYGKKNLAKEDEESKFINTLVITTALVHDSQATEDLLNKNDGDQELFADSAYKGETQEEIRENLLEAIEVWFEAGEADTVEKGSQIMELAI